MSTRFSPNRPQSFLYYPLLCAPVTGFLDSIVSSASAFPRELAIRRLECISRFLVHWLRRLFLLIGFFELIHQALAFLLTGPHRRVPRRPFVRDSPLHQLPFYISALPLLPVTLTDTLPPASLLFFSFLRFSRPLRSRDTFPPSCYASPPVLPAL